MNHCKICGNNIPDGAEDCHQAGFGEGCMKTMANMTHPPQERRENVNTRCTNPKCTNERCVGCLAFAPKDTPDTEWEKEFDGWANNVIEHESERKWIKNFIIRTCVAEWNKGFEKGRSEYLDKARDIDEATSSRDTYWKERVRKEVEGLQERFGDWDNGDENEPLLLKCEVLGILDNLK